MYIRRIIITLLYDQRFIREPILKSTGLFNVIYTLRGLQEQIISSRPTGKYYLSRLN